MEKFPVIKTNRLILRQLTDGDKFDIFRNFSDEAVTRWFYDEPFSTIDQAQALIVEFNQHFVEDSGITWAITLKGDHDVIGTCGLDPYQKDKRGEIGFDLARAYWGKGIMSEALRSVIEFAFKDLLLEAIDADTYCENKRSIVLLERLGFTKLNQVEDFYKFSLEREVWRPL